MIYPAPLRQGSVIAITAFSSGISEGKKARYQHVITGLKNQGYVIIEGDCLIGNSQHVSAPARQRATELMSFLLDDRIDAIAAPWGGELAMEILPLLDFDLLKKAKPKWLFGFSDVSTLTVVISSRLNWASAHSPNLMDLAASETEALTANFLKNMATDTGGRFSQCASLQHTDKWPDGTRHPAAVLAPYLKTNWCWLVAPRNGSRIEGRLIGGCWDTLIHLFDTPYLDLKRYAEQFDEGIILYLENVEMAPADLTRSILSMKFRGVFTHITALLLGRSAYPASNNKEDLTYHEVLQRHLADLGIPVLIDMDIGHVPPNLTLINGALAKVTSDNVKSDITQYLI
ncbi:hypothetical protein MED121_03185 [Marinomonas sp. MED121]|uniref:S66 family peptidase n=1 Tax=Marinomonas sp. MED121 TaxID=314277 RepID=UPI000069054E|nr:S66 peptidase family protein [Marinomonas sp. MED121]EAQ63349.1 hypothetical protein MED121_03185 [Marinomonas sp. MED121]